MDPLSTHYNVHGRWGIYYEEFHHEDSISSINGQVDGADRVDLRAVKGIDMSAYWLDQLFYCSHSL